MKKQDEFVIINGVLKDYNGNKSILKIPEGITSNVMALLLDYKAKNFSDFDPMEEFVMDN